MGACSYIAEMQMRADEMAKSLDRLRTEMSERFDVLICKGTGDTAKMIEDIFGVSEYEIDELISKKLKL